MLCIDLYKDGVPPRRSGTGIVMVLVVSQRGGLRCGGGGGDLSFFPHVGARTVEVRDWFVFW